MVKEYKWLLVQGCPRSGANTLKDFLNTNPQIALSVEADISKTKDKENLIQKYENLFKSKKDLNNIIYFGDKLPEYYHKNLKNLKKVLGGVKVIHITRNPLRVANSIMAKAKTDKMWNPYITFQDIIENWIFAWNFINSHKDILHIKYEDLLKNIQKESEKIAEFLEIENNFTKEFYKKEVEITLNKEQLSLINKKLEKVINNWDKPLPELASMFGKIKSQTIIYRAKKIFKDLIWLAPKKTFR